MSFGSMFSKIVSRQGRLQPNLRIGGWQRNVSRELPRKVAQDPRQDVADLYNVQGPEIFLCTCTDCCRATLAALDLEAQPKLSGVV